jgi:hypothetical protein
MGSVTAEQFESYQDYKIRTYQERPDAWVAEIRKKDGLNLTILLPDLYDDGLRSSLTTFPPKPIAQGAIDLAKRAIDGGGMK